MVGFGRFAARRSYSFGGRARLCNDPGLVIATVDQRSRETTLGMLAVGVTTVTWGFGGVLVKLPKVGGLTLSFWRLWIGVPVMLMICAAARRPITAGALRQSVPAGVVFGVNVVMFFSAVRITSVANATLITALQPALVLFVAGPLFGERVGRREILWTLLALGGVSTVVIGSAGGPAWSPRGDLLAGGALVTWTAYYVFTKHARASQGPFEYMTGVNIGAALAVTPIALLIAPDLGQVTRTDWMWIAGFVLIPGAGGHILITWAHRYVDVVVSSLIVVGVPVIAATAAFVILHEPLGPLQILGGGAVLLAIAAIVLRPSAGDVPEPDIP